VASPRVCAALFDFTDDLWDWVFSKEILERQSVMAFFE
jgi:hypothetical protein